MSIETAINDLRNGYGNEITPKQLKERHDLSNDDLKEICQQNPDITVLMHVRRPPAPKPTEPGLKPSWSMEQVCERMSVKSFMAVMVRSFEANLRNMVATLGDMLNESDLPECHM